LPAHPAWIEPAEWLGGGQATTFPLHLVSSQPRHRLHSQIDAGRVSARGKIAGRETLAINPVDARSRGIGDGEVVRVFNARGVVRPSCGARYDPPGTRTSRPAPTATPMFSRATMAHRG
jgi:biotin/methionine sulfoxide reductase